MAFTAWLNERLVNEPVFGDKFTNIAVILREENNIIVLNDSTLNYAHCKRSIEFGGTIVVGKAHEIVYHLNKDSNGNVWIKIDEAKEVDIDVKNIKKGTTLTGMTVKNAYIAKEAAKEMEKEMAKNAAKKVTTTTTAPAPVTSSAMVVSTLSTTVTTSTTSTTTTAPATATTMAVQQPLKSVSATAEDSSSGEEIIELSGTIVAMTKFQRFAIANPTPKNPQPVANFYLHEKETNKLSLVLIYSSQLRKYDLLLREGKGVKIEDVDEKKADMQGMPSTLKNYASFYIVTDDTEISEIPATEIDIEVVKEHFKLSTIRDIHGSHYTRGDPKIYSSLYAPNFRIQNMYREVPNYSGLNFIDLEIGDISTTVTNKSVRRKKKNKKFLKISFTGDLWRDHIKKLDPSQPILFLDMSVYDQNNKLSLTSIPSSKIVGSYKQDN